MIITYEPKVKHLCTIPFKGKNEKGKVTNGSITLIPGTNEIPDAQWEIMREMTAIKRKIESGELKTVSKIEEIKDTKKRKDGSDTGTEITIKVEKPILLKDMEPVEAVKLIEECNNMEVLKSWNKEKGLSDEVRLAIKQQITVIDEYIKTGVLPKKDGK